MAQSGSATANISPGSSHSWTGLTDVIRAVYSQEVRLQTQPILRFAQFAQHRTELNTQPGNQITMLTFNNLARGGKLAEGTHIETKALGTSTTSLSVFEYGNGIAVTEFLLHSSFVDTMANAVLLLANDAAWVYDNEFRKVDFVGTNVVFANKKANRAALDAAATFDKDGVRKAVETLATNKAPKFSGLGRDAYVCVIHPHQSANFREDMELVSEYAGSGQVFRGEVGRFEDVIFVETTMAPYIDTSGNIFVDNTDTGENDASPHATLTVYQGVIFGADAYGFAEGLPIEMRDNGVVDFGRERALAWYGIAGFGRLDEARMVRIEST